LAKLANKVTSSNIYIRIFCLPAKILVIYLVVMNTESGRMCLKEFGFLK